MLAFPIFQPILVILVSKFMIHRYLSLGLLSPLKELLPPNAYFSTILNYTVKAKKGILLTMIILSVNCCHGN